MFNLAYTFSHAISVSDSFDAGSFTDAWNTKLDKGSTGVPQHLGGSFIYTVPGVQEFGRVLKSATSGWQLSSILVINAGGYFSVSCGSTPLSYAAATNTVNYNCDYNADGQTGDRAMVPSFGNHLDLSRQNMLINGVFKASDFPTPVPGTTTGQMSKSFFRGIGNWNLDMAASRTFKIPFFFHERANFELRGEAFNAPNRVNLGGISTTMTSSTFGRVTSASNARVFQVTGRLSF
jgi:hypothetical protein